MVDWILEKFVLLIGLFCIIMLVLAFLIFSVKTWQEYSTCAKWEDKIVWQEAYTSYQLVGKIFISKENKAQFVQKRVCTKLR